MVFNIYSVGDGKLLSDILNSVAMICNSTSFPSLIFAGFMIGIIIIAFQCLISGGRVINLHFALIGMILYMGLFGTKCSVIVSDAYDDIVYEKIDNVPLAVGVTGMGISNIGHGIASMFEQGFGDVQRTDNFAYAEPLRILNQFRTFSENDEVFAKIDLSLAGNDAAAVKTKHIDSRQSVLNYLSECVMANVATGATTASNLFRGNIEAFSSEDEMKMTYLAIPGGGTMTCKDAFPLFKSIFDPISNDPNMIQWVNRIFGVNETADYTKISAAIQDLSYLNQTAQDWMAMSLLRVQYDHAADQFYRQQLDQTAAINLNQAITQKSYQQASEASLFLVSMRIMMSLIEGLVYAITPLIAFLICTGSFGMRLVGKYLSMLVWIQLWLPVMSITDLYIRSGARDAVRVAFINNQNYSFFANDLVGTAIQTWIGFGGIAAAATPLIALFLVGGSSVAFTSLTNRMMGSDHFNERALAPDVTSAPPILNQAAGFTGDSFNGTSRSGAQPNLTKVVSSATEAQKVSESAALLNQKTAAFKEDYTSSMSDGTGFSKYQSFAYSVGKNALSDLKDTNSAAYNEIQSYAKQHGISMDQVATLSGFRAINQKLGLKADFGFALGAGTAEDVANESASETNRNVLVNENGKDVNYRISDNPAKARAEDESRGIFNKGTHYITPEEFNNKKNLNIKAVNTTAKSGIASNIFGRFGNLGSMIASLTGFYGRIGGSMGADIGGGAKDQNDSKSGSSRNQAKNNSISADTQKALSASFDRSFSKSLNSSQSFSSNENQSRSESGSTNDSLTEMQSASKQYATELSNQRSLSAVTGQSINTIAHQLDYQQREKLYRLEHLMNEDQQKKSNKLSDPNNGFYPKKAGLSPENARAASIIDTLLHHGSAAQRQDLINVLSGDNFSNGSQSGVGSVGNLDFSNQPKAFKESQSDLGKGYKGVISTVHSNNTNLSDRITQKSLDNYEQIEQGKSDTVKGFNEPYTPPAGSADIDLANNYANNQNQIKTKFNKDASVIQSQDQRTQWQIAKEVFHSSEAGAMAEMSSKGFFGASADLVAEKLNSLSPDFMKDGVASVTQKMRDWAHSKPQNVDNSDHFSIADPKDGFSDIQNHYAYLNSRNSYSYTDSTGKTHEHTITKEDRERAANAVMDEVFQHTRFQLFDKESGQAIPGEYVKTKDQLTDSQLTDLMTTSAGLMQNVLNASQNKSNHGDETVVRNFNDAFHIKMNSRH